MLDWNFLKMIIIFFPLWRFVASKNNQSGSYIPRGAITFDQKQVDITNSLDETTGHFEAPIEGTYVFFVNAWVNQGRNSRITVYVNGVKVKDFYDSEDAGLHREMSFFFEVFLKKSDILYLNNPYTETLYIDTYNSITFLGYLM